MSRRVLVTGGAGFIGSHVADLFLSNGWTVEVLDNLSSGKRDNLPSQVSAFHELDIRSQEAADLVREGRFDAVCHLAAQIDVRKSVADPVEDARINVIGSLNLVEAVRRSGAPTRFVFSSTGGALYGDFEVPPSREEAAKEPDAPYGASKLSVEYYLATYSRVLGVDTVALRYANVYGPRQDPHGEAGVVAIFCGRILDGTALTVYGDGEQTRDYVYVGDVARANFLAATKPAPDPGRVDARSMNIGTGVQTSVLQLAALLREVAGSSVPIEHAPARKGELARSAVDVSKAGSRYGWRPEVELRDGLRRTYEWFAGQRSPNTKG